MKEKRRELSISTRGFILILVPLLFQVGLLLVLSVQLQNAEMEVQKQMRAKAIISQSNALSKLFYDAGVAMGGYSITKSPLFTERYAKITKQIPEDLASLKELVGDDPRQKARIIRLEQIIRDGLKILDQAKSAIDDNRVDVAQFRARHMYKQVRQLADMLQAELKLLTAEESRFVSLPWQQQRADRIMLRSMLYVGLVVNLVLGLCLWFMAFLNSLRAVRMPHASPAVQAPEPVVVPVDSPVCESHLCESPAVRSSKLFAMSRPPHGHRGKIIGLPPPTTKYRRFRTKPPARRAS
ncbi:MAG: CHASE3 domain-containing protein [Cyanobacteria bacterium SZAS LIN-3]|nr:CHASE3 domain-containing protein [Cyanobacteria bacterium SZAS LIN-3]